MGEKQYIAECEKDIMDLLEDLSIAKRAEQALQQELSIARGCIAEMEKENTEMRQKLEEAEERTRSQQALQEELVIARSLQGRGNLSKHLGNMQRTRLMICSGK